jgi:hypothetical protein
VWVGADRGTVTGELRENHPFLLGDEVHETSRIRVPVHNAVAEGVDPLARQPARQRFGHINLLMTAMIYGSI